MKNDEDNANDEGDISDIRSESLSDRILGEWRRRKTIRQISDELNLPIQIVEQILKARQKTLIQKGSLKL